MADDSISLASSSQAGNFLEDQCASSGNDSVGSTEGDTMISKESSSCNPSGCFRILVYCFRRYMSDMLMSSSPRLYSAPSDFIACSGLVEPDLKGFILFRGGVILQQLCI